MHTLYSKFMPAVIYTVYVAVHLLITLMLILTTSVHMSTSTCTYSHTLTRHIEPTLTVDNLTAVLDNVQENMEFVLLILHIPRSKVQYGRGQVNTARADYIIDHHPSPSWMIVANALWFNKAAGALEMVQELYLKGEPCAHSCGIEGRIGSGL